MDYKALSARIEVHQHGASITRKVHKKSRCNQKTHGIQTMAKKVALRNKQNGYHGFDVSTQNGRIQYMRHLDQEERPLDYRRGTPAELERVSVCSTTTATEIGDKSRYSILTSILLLLSMVIVVAIIIFIVAHFVR
jgi:hypothetical protein